MPLRTLWQTCAPGTPAEFAGTTLDLERQLAKGLYRKGGPAANYVAPKIGIPHLAPPPHTTGWPATTHASLYGRWPSRFRGWHRPAMLSQQHGFDEVTDEQIAWRLGCGHHLSLFTWCDRALAHAGFGLCPIALACRCVPCVKPALQVPSIASIAQRLDLRFYLRRIGRLRCSHGVLGVASMNVSPPCGAL